MPHSKCQCHFTSEVYVVPALVFLTNEKSGHLKIRWPLGTNPRAKFHKNRSTGSKVTKDSKHTRWMGTWTGLTLIIK